jgi:hypothetical protein
LTDQRQSIYTEVNILSERNIVEELNKKLVKIQQELKAPKSLKNNFANFDYRSAEKILESVKPLVHKEDLTITLSDEVTTIGISNYVKSTASLSDGTNKIETVAYAREEEEKKGMDTAQITGSTSSYARKYALNGLFAIDDTTDPDGRDNSDKTGKTASKPATKPKVNTNAPATLEQRSYIRVLLDKKMILRDDMPTYLETEFGIIPGEPMTSVDASNIIKQLKEETES